VRKPRGSIESDVRDELDWDPMLDDKRIFVQASDGRVTLTGAVGSFSELLRASDDARSVRGVRTVDNELLVAPAGEAIADATVAADCTAALDADRFVPHGAVLSDEIVVSGESSPTDVVERIREAFRRNAVLDGSRIEVSRSGDIICLDGTTSSWAAMEEAVETAGEAPGVTEVVNRLVVRA